MTASKLAGLLEGQTAVVTGAAQGNGYAIALGLARAGATVVVADMNGAGAAAAAAEIAGEGLKAWSAALDVSDWPACRALAAEVEQRSGKVSVLVNNAGILRRAALDAPSIRDDWSMTFKVNVDGPFNMVTTFLDQLVATKGRIINVGSIQSFVSAPNSASYTASKGAVIQFTKALAAELGPKGVRVNGIAPGVIATPMTDSTRNDPEKLGRFLAHTPIGRVGEPHELIGPAVFLASDLSSYVHGVMLPVDGGYLAV